MTPVTVLADEISSEGVDRAPLVSSEGTVTIMFSDIESSAEITARLGDQAWLAVLRSTTGSSATPCAGTVAGS